MIRKLIQWSLDNCCSIVLMAAVALAGVGVYSFMHINVEAYPDPAPPTVEVVAQFPGASAEEVERQVTIPLEVTLAGMPGLHAMNTKTVFGLSDIKMLFDYGTEYKDARQETINRLQSTQPLPPGVTPQISPESPTGEIYRYWLKAPKDAAGRNIYSLNDLKALQDWVLEREFRTVPRVVDITSWGGTIRRYEVQPDPDRMRRYGITLAQLQNVLTNSNATVGGDYVDQGDVALTVRSVGLFGGGEDPVRKVLGMSDPVEAAKSSAKRRSGASAISAPWSSPPSTTSRCASKTWSRAGGWLPGERAGEKGVVVRNQTRLGKMAHFKVDDGYESDFQSRPFAEPRQGRPRRSRPGGLHRAAAQGRGHPACPRGHRSQGQGTQRSRRPGGCCRAARSCPTTTARN